MAKERISGNNFNAKVAIFWGLILAITIIFAVLFAVRIYDTRTFDSYEDLEKADLNLVYDITSKDGYYYVYMYHTKEDENGKLVDSSKTDIIKANEVLPSVFNYFNYVRRHQKMYANDASFYKIYGYNVRGANDDNLIELGLKLSDLPVLVKVDGNTNKIEDSPFKTVSAIQKELTNAMNHSHDDDHGHTH